MALAFEVPAGRFGFCSLVLARVPVEVECVVVAQDEAWAIILGPKSEGMTTASASAEDGVRYLQLRGLDVSVELRRVECDAIRALSQSREASFRFGDLLAAFYQIEYGSAERRPNLVSSATEDNSRSRSALEKDIQRLQKELPALRRTSLVSREGRPLETAGPVHHGIASDAE